MATDSSKLDIELLKGVSHDLDTEIRKFSRIAADNHTKLSLVQRFLHDWDKQSLDKLKGFMEKVKELVTVDEKEAYIEKRYELKLQGIVKRVIDEKNSKRQNSVKESELLSTLQEFDRVLDRLSPLIARQIHFFQQTDEKLMSERQQVNILLESVQAELELLNLGKKLLDDIKSEVQVITSDTHLHSSFSDGIWSPERLVEEAKKRGLTTIAITDHNTVGGVKRALKKARELGGITVIPGIELGCETNIDGIEIWKSEILGYGIRTTDTKKFLQKMKEFTQPTRNVKMTVIVETLKRFKQVFATSSVARQNRIAADENRSDVIKVLKKRHSDDEISSFYNRNLFDLKKDVGRLTITPLSFMNYSMNRSRGNLIRTLEELDEILDHADLSYFGLAKFIFDHLLENKDQIAAHVDGTIYGTAIRMAHKNLFLTAKEIKEIEKKENARKYTYAEVIEAINDAGGFAVLAHPALAVGIKTAWLDKVNPKHKDGLPPNVWIRELAKVGLKGIELYYYPGKKFSVEESAAANKLFLQLARRYHLAVTYGSDCHGPYMGKEENIFLGKVAESSKVLHLVKRSRFFGII